MTTARAKLICPQITPYYHCVSRCVRRSFLCGQDHVSGRSYEHRRQWVEDKILHLAAIYCIDICAYAVMSNHYHLVVRIDHESALALSPAEVIERWSIDHHLPAIIQRFKSAQTTQPENDKCMKIIETWRERLSSLSWFMKELNFDIALQANKEDECTGHFWEGRFKSQALLDEKALLAAMAYVDLNPVRAKEASTPEKSRYTSLKLRLSKAAKGLTQSPPLLNFVGFNGSLQTKGLPFSFQDYLHLVDWLGRQIKPDKAGHISSAQPDILTRLALSAHDCLYLCTQLEAKPRLWIGGAQKLLSAKNRLNRRRMVGLVIS
ncbi:transposase [Vibrio sp. ABG19]|uniref:transposase n=1 Tax=Vibrio sp. ABG19 TaxID=2817385 RepID=UPI00249E838A|nr:transposase [Vibrio sp. ABG19]WGY45522.1 transposase [Vibrio sp. ABG19]